MGKTTARFAADLVNRVRQFGLPSAAAQIVRAAMRPLVQTNRELVFIIPGFKGYEFHDPCISPLTAERLERAAAAGELDESQARLLRGFIAEGSLGICAEVDGRLAGYGWMQFAGEYRYGPWGRLPIPLNYAIAKNHMVLPAYRGCKLGPKLNAARLAMISAGKIPVGFIIPGNRYAIRNWEALGFQRVLQVRQTWCLRGRVRTSVSWLNRREEAESLYRALVESNRG